MDITLVSSTQHPQKLIETCARISYASKNDPYDPDVNSKFIKKLIEHGHESPLEHAFATFYIEGISRTCSHQIVRHRLASFTQRSSRYTEPTDDFVRPESITCSSNANVLEKAFTACTEAYHAMIEAGIPKEDARFILPQAEKTSLYMTANFREWRHFLKLRLDRHAQWEIREVAKAILSALISIAPDVFSDLQEEQHA